MSSPRILIVAEHDGARLNVATAKCVTCARAIDGGEISVAVFAVDGAAIAAEAAALAGVTRVLVINHPANAHALAAVLAPQVAAVASGYSHVFGPSTTFGKDLIPRVAGLLGAPQLSDVMAAESATRFRRPTYAGNALVTVEIEPGTQILATVRTASFQAAGAGGSAPIETVAVEANIPTHTRFVSVSAASSDRPDLQTARRVISAAPRTSSSSTRWPTASARRSARPARRSMRATRRMSCRWARPARSSPRSSISPAASRGPSST
jgi:electron transfer flavoprotein alpha subunit